MISSVHFITKEMVGGIILQSRKTSFGCFNIICKLICILQKVTCVVLLEPLINKLFRISQSSTPTIRATKYLDCWSRALYYLNIHGAFSR